MTDVKLDATSLKQIRLLLVFATTVQTEEKDALEFGIFVCLEQT